MKIKSKPTNVTKTTTMIWNEEWNELFCFSLKSDQTRIFCWACPFEPEDFFVRCRWWISFFNVEFSTDFFTLTIRKLSKQDEKIWWSFILSIHQFIKRKLMSRKWNYSYQEIRWCQFFHFYRSPLPMSILQCKHHWHRLCHFHPRELIWSHRQIHFDW